MLNPIGPPHRLLNSLFDYCKQVNLYLCGVLFGAWSAGLRIGIHITEAEQHHFLMESFDLTLVHLYADDSQDYLGFTIECIPETAVTIKACLHDIRQWLLVNLLKDNPDKTVLTCMAQNNN